MTNTDLNLSRVLQGRKQDLNNLVTVFNQITSPNEVEDLSPEQLKQNLIDYIDTRVATKLPINSKLLLTPNFKNVVFSDYSLTNVDGNLISEYDNIADKTYYRWTTSATTIQSKKIIVFCQTPEKFSAWNNYKFSCYIDGEASIEIDIFDTKNNKIVTRNVNIGSGWLDLNAIDVNLASLNNGIWTGEKFKIIFTLHSKNNGIARVSDILLNFTRGDKDIDEINTTFVNNLYTAITIAQLEPTGIISTPTMFVDTFVNLDSIANADQLMPFFSTEQNRFIIG